MVWIQTMTIIDCNKSLNDVRRNKANLKETIVDSKKILKTGGVWNYILEFPKYGMLRNDELPYWNCCIVKSNQQTVNAEYNFL